MQKSFSIIYRFFFSMLVLFTWSVTPLYAGGTGTASDPFTTLDDAALVRTPGIYHFSLSNTFIGSIIGSTTTFSTYVDGNGYVLVAIDFGHARGSIPEKNDLDTTSRGILPSNALNALNGIERVRISSTSTSAGGIDVITTDSTLISRVQNGDTLKIGRSDNTINKSWTGSNAQYITDDAKCDKSNSGLKNRIIHQCGNGSGFHWVSEQNIHKITWGSGEIDSGDSLRLWVRGSLSSNGSASNLPPTDISLSNNTVDENQPADTVVGTFSTTDPDANETFTYRLIDSQTYPANNSFWIDDGKLKTNEVFDYETRSSYQIKVQVTDSAGHTYEETFNIQINNLPENVCHGCDCSLDDDTQNSTSPGITIPALDHATSDVSTCLSGISDDADFTGKKDYYNFTVDVDGEFNLTATSPTNDYFHLEIKVNGTTVYPDTVEDSHTFYTSLSAGDQVIFYFKESGSDLDEYEAHLVFTTSAPPDFTCSHPHQFTTRYNEYVPGDLVAIGNSNICADVDPNNSSRHGDGICDTNQRRRNDTTNVIHINKWSSTNSDITGLPDAQASTLLNVTNAELKLPPGAKVKWAGLYWQGEVWNFKKGAITNQYGNDSGDDGEAMMAKEMEVSFMRPNDNRFSTLKADELYWFNLYRKQKWGGTGQSWGYGYGSHFGYSNEHYFLYHNIMRYEHHYQGFKDVTKLLQEVETQTGSANGKYWVGNIQATVGLLGYPGVEAAWTLQVVYDLPTAQPRVITVTDGYLGLYSSASQGDDYVDDVNQNANANCQKGAANTGVYAYDVSFDIDNILTPKTKPDFATDMTVFATESDPDTYCASDSLPEQLTITRKDGSTYVVDGNPASLPGANPRETCDAWHYSITNKDGSDNLDRSPNDIYPIGMTLRNYHMTDALSNDQNSTHITFKTDTDRLIIGVIGFATDLKAPELCYDYDVRIGDYIKIPSTDRHFETDKWGNEDLQLKILIRSKEADFDFENAKLWITFTPDDVFEYHSGKSEISPEGINAYLPATETDSTKGVITIGHDYTNPQGGILGPNESTYIKQRFKFLKNTFNGSFDIYVEGNVSYIPGEPPIGYRLSTAIPAGDDGHIGRCPTNPVYDPIWGQFNVENAIASTSADAKERYPLYTQVAGRPYEVNVVSYTKNSSTGQYNTRNPIHATVEMELIDVSPFDNNASAGYDSTCQEPVAASKGDFIKFDNVDTITVKPTDFKEYNDKLVLRNAAFRIWMLTRAVPGSQDRELVDHNCNASDDSSCFDALYAQVYETHEDNKTRYCKNECDNSSGTTCYDCLRTYFARPVCSRDNFSIRPEGFRIMLNDTNETNGSGITPVALTNNTSTVQQHRLAAGYHYQLKAEATAYGNTAAGQQLSEAYYRVFDTQTSVNPLPTDARTSRTQTILEFNGNPACADHTNTAYAIKMINSITPSDEPAFVNSNAGEYTLWMSDADWTLVDQARYQYKKFFDTTCRPNDTRDQCNECLLNETRPDSPTKEAGCTISSVITGTTGSNYKEIPLRFEPYSFDLSSIRFATNPPNQRHLFMTDFDDPYYNSSASLSNPMAAYYEGNVTAISKDGKITTNFSDGCVASDIILKLYRETNASEDDLKNQFGIEFQQYLQYGSGLASQTNFNDKQIGKDANLTLSKSAFEDNTAPGSASIRIYTTFKKPAKDDILDGSEGINPVQVTYKKIDAADTDANSSAHLSTHIPTGEQQHNRSVTFFYGKVTPDQKLYTTDDSNVSTPLNIIIYCDHGKTACQHFDLNSTIHLQHETSNWYLAANLFNNASDLGLTDLNVSYDSGQLPGNAILQSGSASTGSGTQQLADLGYQLNGTQPDISVALPSTDPRPVTVKVVYTSSPWLEYDIADQFYRVLFNTTIKWTGLNKTGHVVETNISTTRNNRVEW